jgi:hypothetical protein
MFLRQAVMRGGIPFTLNVPRGQGDGAMFWTMKPSLTRFGGIRSSTTTPTLT